MKATLTQYAKIAAKALAKALVIAITGILFSKTTFFIGLWLSHGAIEGGSGGGHGNPLVLIVWLIELFQAEPMTAVLLAGFIPAIYLYVNLAFLMLLYESIHGFWRTGAGDKITTKITRYVEAFLAKNNWMMEGAQKGRLKMQLLKQAKEDRTAHPIERRALRYGFKKLKLEEINWSDKENLSASIASQVNKKISEVIQPSMKPFWILFLIHVLCLIAAFIFDK